MKKAVISIAIAVVLGLVILNALTTHVVFADGNYECFGTDCEYHILSGNGTYTLFGPDSPTSLMLDVYSYSVHDKYISLYGIVAGTHTPTYMVVDYKSTDEFHYYDIYNNIENAPVEFRKYLAKLPTHPTLPETILTRILRRHGY